MAQAKLRSCARFHEIAAAGGLKTSPLIPTEGPRNAGVGKFPYEMKERNPVTL